MRLLTAVGVAAVLAGFLVLFDRGLAGVLDLSSVAVTLVGVLGVVQGIRYANARRRRDAKSVSLGEPERRARVPVPGDDVDELIDRAAGRGHRRYELRRRLRSRVRDVVVTEVARARNCDPSTAAALVDSGEWTTDATAAAFLADGASYPVGVRVRARFRGPSLYATGLTAAVDAVGTLAAGSPGTEASHSERDESASAATERRTERNERNEHPEVGPGRTRVSGTGETDGDGR